MRTDLKKLRPWLWLLMLPTVGRAQFSFVVLSNTVTITRYIGSGGAVTIPSVIVDLPVTGIGDSAFSGSTAVTSISIPTSVTTIGTSAFANCTGLADVTIPGGVTNIGSGAFAFCSKLTALSVAAPGTAYSGVGGVLFNVTQTALVEYPAGKAGDYVIPNGVTNIGDAAFYSCASLTDITIPNSVTNIGDYGFANCTSLTNAYFMGNAPAAGATVFSEDSNVTAYYWSTNTGWSAAFAGRPAIPWNPVILSQPPLTLFACPGSSFSFGVAANGKPPLGYQWRRNGTNLTDSLTYFGSTNAQLTLSNLTAEEVGSYDVVVTNSGGSTSSVVTALALGAAPARATPVLLNGFIVGANLVDGGCGYTNSPMITFVGSSGTGGLGYGQISNGSVTNIVITSAGSGYSAETILQVGPPFYPLLILESSEVVLPSGAATPVVVNGFIVGANLTSPGTGYESPPNISFADVTGQGAAATAEVTNGGITGIVITMAGSGYSSNATLTIDAPPLQQALIISASNLMAGQDYQLLNATDLAGWTPLGAPLSATQSTSALITNLWSAVTNSSQTFFRLQLVP